MRPLSTSVECEYQNQAVLRRRKKPSPTNPTPSNASVPGSGTAPLANPDKIAVTVPVASKQTSVAASPAGHATEIAPGITNDSSTFAKADAPTVVVLRTAVT